MSKLVAVLLIALIACASGAPSKHGSNGRIVGGFPVDIKQVPWQVALIYNTRLSCGGSIIGNRWILTAAHCLEGYHLNLFEVQIGETHIVENDALYEVDKMIIHEDYGGASNPDFDFGLLRLKKELSFNDRAKAVPLPKVGDADIAVDTMCFVSGWGLTKNFTESNKYLRAVEVPKFDQDLCNKAYGGIVTSRMFCAGYEKGGKDSCNGDSGGAVVVFNDVTKSPVQVGIISWGNECAKPGFPGVYARILAARQWIHEHTGI